MTITFDTDTIRLITLFENMTGVGIKDCMVDDKNVYFVIDKEKIGLAIGKNGNKVKELERLIKKNVKIFEFSSDLATFVKNLIPNSIEIKIRSELENKNIVEIKVERGSRAIVIGREGKNIKLYKELLQRNHRIDDLILR